MFWNLLLPPILATACISFMHYLITLFRSRDSVRLWAQLETVSIPPGRVFPWARAVIHSIISIQGNVHRGYHDICKEKNRPFALPTMWMGGAVVVLPPSQINLLNKPDSELTGFNALLDTIQLPYMVSDREVYENVIHFDVVRKKMTKKDIGSLAAATAEEINVALLESWGTSTEWKNFNGWGACGRIIAQATLRVLIGLPLCRDEVLLEQTRLYSNSLFAGNAVINCLPPFVRPLLGPLVASPTKFYQYRCQRILIPFVEERIALWKETNEAESMPDDFLHWLIPSCAKAGLEQLDPARIAMRLLALNTMFIFAMGYVFAHCVFDLYGSPSRDEFLSSLETECQDVWEAHHGLSSKEAVDCLYRIDSAVRESMRISDVGVTSLPRDVVSGAIDIGHGIQVPQGVRMVFPTQPIHLDPEHYDNPLRYDAFRFIRNPNGLAQPRQRERGDQLLTSVSPSFLAFGYGRHACPGRWFVAQTIKQALAYVVMNYDVELVGGTVRRKALLNMMVPPTDAQIRIRRKPCGGT
ncbi:cytochrome P450 [Hypoxylon crocopeplum]|nr:cytochrome P450 [Hypoxylon crocopeplum]